MVEVLKFSGGWQSSVLLWMAIRGEIELPRTFAVVTADTGDERARTYKNIELLQDEARKAGLKVLGCPNEPKIPADFCSEYQGKRIETIPYWVKNEDGSRGQLSHCCTRHYKIRPMRRAVTRWLQTGIKPYIRKRDAERIPVCEWVGFAADEEHRVARLKNEGRWTWRCPLVEMGKTKDDCVGYIRDRNLPEPIPSLCAGCFGQGLRMLKWLYENDRPAWERTVERDEYVRHGLRRFGVERPVFVSDTLIPLEQLAKQGFRLATTKETAEHECSSGVCFA